ncbi:putative autotransporter adhesin-like protein [Lacinutrix venerupis]|uniref:head GIN domain-containing protein n=1 Tax=Lacinutrix venerupis TaxID=1486034 RepID=UPI000EAEA4EA|nr:head GIN domain-containing protein [Lacinutrix venerupis]RLJ63346.1 putative autotransporter adhesin-like protein [Lacinutrix venerupis]
MKYITTVVLLFMSIAIFGQNPKEMKVQDFNTVKVFDLIHISLVKANENKVIISGQDADDVEIISKNGILKVRMKFDRIFDGTKTFVAVHYTNLEVIDGNEGTKIVGNELIVQDKIELRAQEGAVLKIGLDVKNLEVRSVSGGIIATKGKAQSQEIVLNTGGIYEGREFETENTIVKIKAGGEADVNASETVDARVTAGGDIYIYGNPNNVTKKHTFGGKIEIKK